MQEHMDDDAFTPTPEMIDRHAHWVEEVVDVVWAQWTANGEIDEFPELAVEGIKIVRAELMVADRPKWMHPLDSIALLAAAPELLTVEQKPEYADAMRTAAGIGPYEQAQWVARAMGTSVATARKYGPKFRKERIQSDPGRTAVYRHYDDAGTLLYIGMTNNPDQRFILHAYTSLWHPFSTRCDVEWFDTRVEATDAERDAIAGERPLFNIIGSHVDPRAADEYILERVKLATL